MKPTALLLRNFHGIKDGLGLDEIQLDFSVLPNGTIVLAGENGKGKTTLLDNMHPFRVMPSKVTDKYSPAAFNFYDECYGSNACKDLYWTDNEGQKYRSLININAEKRKQEAYLYRIDGNGKQDPINQDGKTGSYDTALETILCKPELYFISDFRAQNAKYVSDYSNGDIKGILSELLGIDYIRTLSKSARFVYTELSNILRIAYEERQGLKERLSHKSVKEADLETLQERAQATENILEAKEKEKAELEGILAELRSKEVIQESLVLKKQELSDEITRKEGIVSTIQKEADKRIQRISHKVRELSEKIASVRDLVALTYQKRVEIEKLKGREAKKAELQEAISHTETGLSEVQGRLKEIAGIENTLREKEKALSEYSHASQLKIASLKSEQEQMQKEAGKLQNVPCKDTELAGTCEFVKDAVDASRRLPGKIEELKQYVRESEVRMKGLRDALVPLKEECKDKSVLSAKETELSKSLAASRKNLSECEAALEKAGKLEKEISEAMAADKNLPDLEQRLTEETEALKLETNKADKDVLTARTEITSLIKKRNEILIEEGLGLQRQETEKKIAALRDKINELRSEEKTISRNSGALEAEVNAYPGLQEQLEAVEERVAHIGNEVSEWTIMAKALGDEGIVALEIDDAGPSISKLVNDLLREVYGNRMTIRIDTQDTTGKKLKEDFDITVIDNRSNTTKSIKKVSGGEKELLEDLIPKAVGLFNKQRTGRGSSTLFTDERDGALDAGKKKPFFLMKTRVQALGDYKQEFCITHTPELIKMANGVLELKDGGVAMYTNN